MTYSPVNRIAAFLYGVICYVIFFCTFLYAIGFVGNILVPKSIDSPAEGSLLAALLIDALLLAAFALQHSVMARPAFKRWWTRYVPEVVERSTYVLFSSLLLIALFAFWQPLGGTVWVVENYLGRNILWLLFTAGWSLVLISTFLINHFDLFGLRQVWLHLRSKEYTDLSFGTPGLYKLVRHPLYVGWLFAFWFTPVMTAAHLFFAIGTTAYILIAIRFEERDLVNAHGKAYADYRNRVPMLVPRLGRPSPAPKPEPTKE